MQTSILTKFGIHSLILSPLFHPDAGVAGAAGEGGAGASSAGAGSGGAAAGSGSGRQSTGGQGAGAAGTGGQQGTGGQAGANDAFEFSDTARIRLSDGRVVTGAQYREELNAAARTAAGTAYQRGYDMLMAEAKRLDAMRGQGSNGGRAPQVDPLAEIENLPAVDGKTLASLYRTLQQNGLTPIANVVAQMQRELQTLRANVGQFGQRFGAQDEDSERERFHQTLDQTLQTIKVNGLSTPLDAKNEAIRALAENLHLSYVPGTWRAGEFEKMLSDQVQGLFEYFKQAMAQERINAQDNLRRNFNPNRGGGSPGGRAAAKFQTPREIARMAADAGMFGGSRT